MPMDPATGLAGLFLSSFLSATLLPGNSEIVLGALQMHDPTLRWSAIAVATVGNTLGGMTSYAIGRVVPKPEENRAVRWLHRHGPAALLLSWVPVIGDALCVASGWLRQDALAAAAFMAAGKFVRYLMVAKGVAWFIG
jgi:membrane protein YqaA with SNARE-associated domain